MIDKTIRKIQDRIEKTDSIDGDRKRELLGLIETLDKEVKALSRTRREQAESVARFAELVTHEATRRERDASLVDASVKGLAASVQNFEVSHPRLVEIVNQMCMTLADMGI